MSSDCRHGKSGELERLALHQDIRRVVIIPIAFHFFRSAVRVIADAWPGYRPAPASAE
jgi:hypothetical protein